jgi:sortase (surface protein transpeptidase)
MKKKLRKYLNFKKKANQSKAEQHNSEKQFNADVNSLKSDYNLNKNKVIDYLIDNVLDVDLAIPAVIKGNFSSIKSV